MSVLHGWGRRPAPTAEQMNVPLRVAGAVADGMSVGAAVGLVGVLAPNGVAGAFVLAAASLIGIVIGLVKGLRSWPDGIR